MTSRFIAAILLLTVFALSVQAGEWNYTVLGTGATPSTVRVSVGVTADFSGQCIEYSTCFIIGGFSVHVSPAPPAQSHYCVDGEYPDATGVTYSVLCVAADGSLTWEIDLDSDTDYTLTAGQSSATWGTFEQGGGCNPHDLCTKVDAVFDEMHITNSTVSARYTTWSALRWRYKATP